MLSCIRLTLLVVLLLFIKGYPTQGVISIPAHRCCRSSLPVYYVFPSARPIPRLVETTVRPQFSVTAPPHLAPTAPPGQWRSTLPMLIPWSTPPTGLLMTSLPLFSPSQLPLRGGCRSSSGAMCSWRSKGRIPQQG